MIAREKVGALPISAWLGARRRAARPPATTTRTDTATGRPRLTERCAAVSARR